MDTFIDLCLLQVYLYEFPARNRQAPKIRTFLRGDSAGSYFGAALGAADITGDGLDDLLVGAPYGVQPKVHVFLGNKWVTDFNVPIIILRAKPSLLPNNTKTGSSNPSCKPSFPMMHTFVCNCSSRQKFLIMLNFQGALIVPPTGAKFLLMPHWGRFSRFGISIATADINQDGYSGG